MLKVAREILAVLLLARTGAFALDQNPTTSGTGILPVQHARDAHDTEEHGIPASRWDDPMIDFGTDRVSIPPALRRNDTSVRTVQLLGQAMQRSNVSAQRIQYLSEIAACKLNEGAPFIRAGLEDHDPSVAGAAVRAAGILLDPSLRDDLSPFLQNPDPLTRRDAVVACYAIDTRHGGSSPAISSALSQDERTIVEVSALRRASPQDADRIVKLLGHDPTVVVEAIRALARIKASDKAGYVAAFFASSDVSLRSAAAEAAAAMHALSLFDPVVKMLDDPHPTVRRSALGAVAQLADETMQQRIALAALKDADPSVRTVAATILADHPLIEAVGPLFDQIPVPYQPLHDAALQALANPVSAAMREAVSIRAAALLEDTDAARRHDASYLLGRLRSDRNVVKHISFLQIRPIAVDNDFALMAQAARSLGEMNATSAGPLLALITERAPVSIRFPSPTQFIPDEALGAAFVAAGKIGYKPVLKEAMRILGAGPEEQTPMERAGAVFALAELTDSSASDVNDRLVTIAAGETEGSAAQVEAIKGLVRRRAVSAALKLRGLGEKSPRPPSRFFAHWAADELTGQTTPYSPPISLWHATTTISDLTPRQ